MEMAYFSRGQCLQQNLVMENQLFQSLWKELCQYSDLNVISTAGPLCCPDIQGHSIVSIYFPSLGLGHVFHFRLRDLSVCCIDDVETGFVRLPSSSSSVFPGLQLFHSLQQHRLRNLSLTIVSSSVVVAGCHLHDLGHVMKKLKCTYQLKILYTQCLHWCRRQGRQIVYSIDSP